MNSTVFRISLDIHEVNSQVTLRVKKGDSARQILIALTEGGRPYKISEDCMAVFTAKKSDDTILYNGCEIQGNRILYAMTPQTCTAVGAMKCEIRVYGADGALITSPRFTILVDDTVYSDGDVVDSASEFSALTELVMQTQKVAEAWAAAERKAVIARSPLGVDYSAEVEGLEIAAGTEILLIPQSANAFAPTLSINGGEAFPLCLRPGWNVTGDDRNPQLTLPIPSGMLLRGAEYVFRFDGDNWILQSHVEAAPEYDVTESYRRSADYQDQPQEFLRSLGAGKWTLDDDWAVYSTHCWEVSGTTWQDERYWTDDGYFRRKLSANGQEVVYLDSGDGVLRINGQPLSGAAELDWAEMDAVIGEAIAEGGGGLPESGVTEARMQVYVTERLQGYVTQEAMKAYVEEYVDSFVAEIPIAEEGAY